jgi:hypothetical protein
MCQKGNSVDDLQLQFKDAVADQSDVLKSYLVSGDELVVFLAKLLAEVHVPPHSAGVQSLRR